MIPDASIELFKAAFGKYPDVIASAPGRVNLIGEHLDYNGGEVLPVAIASRTWVAMRQLPQGSSSRVVSSTEEDTGMFDLPHPVRSGSWWDYVSGVGGLPGKMRPPAEIAVTSDLPAGAGLSSSAALEVAAGFAYAALADEDIDPREIALDGWRAETGFVGVASGIMDQFASALSREGNALHIWCDSATTDHVQFPGSVLIFDTAVPRSLRSSAFNTRRAECAAALDMMRVAIPGLPNLASATRDQVLESRLPPDLEKRALHVASEMERVRQAVAQLSERGTIEASILYESHESLRDRYQCSSPELDWFVDRAARIEGVEGARLTGAGWGGCAIAFGGRDALAHAAGIITRDYWNRFGRAPRTWLSGAGAGGRIEFFRESR